MKNSKPDSLKIVKAQQLSFLDLEQNQLEDDNEKFKASSDFELDELSLESLGLDSDDSNPVNEIVRQVEKLYEQIEELKLQLAQCYKRIKELGCLWLEDSEGDVISVADWMN
jgi:hypothetical protein